MKATEAAALLTIAAAYDNRKPDADQARAWAMVLDGLRFEDCRTAIVEHYKVSREWLMPVEVVAGVKKIRRERVLAYGVIEPPAGVDPDDTAAYNEWHQRTLTAIADGDMVNPLPTLPGGPRAPWNEEETRAVMDARMKTIRAELAKRAPASTPVPDEIRKAAAGKPMEETDA